MTHTSVPPNWGRIVLYIGVAVTVTAPLGVWSDGAVRFDSLALFLRTGTLDNSKYSMYGPLLAAPLWCAGEAVGQPKAAVGLFNRVVLLATLFGLLRVLRPLLSGEERSRFGVFVLLASMFPWHVAGFFAETFNVCCVGLGTALLVTRRGWRAVLGAALCVYGTANVPATAVALALAVGVLVWHRRRVRYLALPALAAALILLENEVRRGGWLAGGYAGEAGHRTVMPYSARPDFSYPLFFGLLAVLFSFGRGLVFFVPGLFARLPESEDRADESDLRLLYRVWLAAVVGLVLVYARWWAWYGGATWGPRFFLFAALPAALALARRTARAEGHSTPANALTLLAVVLSCWVGVNGLVYGGAGLGRYWDNDFAEEHLTWFVPECSSLWVPFVETIPLQFGDYPRFAAFGLACAYLAWPVVRVLAVRARAGAADAWRALRAGPRWRF